MIRLRRKPVEVNAVDRVGGDTGDVGAGAPVGDGVSGLDVNSVNFKTDEASRVGGVSASVNGLNGLDVNSVNFKAWDKAWAAAWAVLLGLGLSVGTAQAQAPETDGPAEPAGDTEPSAPAAPPPAPAAPPPAPPARPDAPGGAAEAPTPTPAAPSAPATTASATPPWSSTPPAAAPSPTAPSAAAPSPTAPSAAAPSPTAPAASAPSSALMPQAQGTRPTTLAPAPAPSSGYGTTVQPSKEPDSEAPVEYARLPLGGYQEHWLLQAGVRVGAIQHRAFDVFAADDALAQFSLAAGRSVFAAERFSLAVLGIWDYGTRADQARGLSTELHVHRLSAGFEARYHLLHPLYVFGRIAPGALLNLARLDTDARLNSAPLESNRWAFSLDASLGAAFQVVGPRDSRVRRARFWVVAEGGYGYSTPGALSFAAPSDSQRGAVAPVELGELAVRGPMVRVAVAMTY